MFLQFGLKSICELKMDNHYVIFTNGKMIDCQPQNQPINASKDYTVIEFKFNPNLTKLSLDENNNIIQTNIISNDKRILQLVMKYLQSNNIFKYADKVNKGELEYANFQKHIENSLDFKLLNE